LSFVAVRAADARARLVVASRPSVSTSAPAPVSVHQTGWLAAASPSGADSWSWVVMIAPTIATRGAVLGHRKSGRAGLRTARDRGQLARRRLAIHRRQIPQRRLVTRHNRSALGARPARRSVRRRTSGGCMSGRMRSPATASPRTPSGRRDSRVEMRAMGDERVPGEGRTGRWRS
jgi:hypothetical protein